MFNGKDFQRNIFIPIYDSHHWMLVVVKCYEKRIEFYDTFHTDGSQFCKTVLEFMEEEARFTGRDFDRNDWTVTFSTDIPRQSDNHR